MFSRNGDESTSRFPDLINIIKESCKPDADTFILDAEVKNVCGHRYRILIHFTYHTFCAHSLFFPFSFVERNTCFVYQIVFF